MSTKGMRRKMLKIKIMAGLPFGLWKLNQYREVRMRQHKGYNMYSSGRNIPHKSKRLLAISQTWTLHMVLAFQFGEHIWKAWAVPCSSSLQEIGEIALGRGKNQKQVGESIWAFNVYLINNSISPGKWLQLKDTTQDYCPWNDLDDR